MDFNKILKDLKSALFETLGTQYAGFKTETKKDLETFLKTSEDKLKRWTQLLAEGSINLKDYEWLIQSQKDLMQMKALQQAGISKISLGHFKNKVVKTIVDVMKGLIF